MAIVRLLINGQVPVPVVAPPPPAMPPAPPPPALVPASSSPAISPELLAAAGVTQAQADAATAAAAAAAAGMAALMAGQGSSGIASAEQAAGAPQGVVQALLDLGIPDITSLIVASTEPPGGAVGDTDDLDESARIALANRPDLSNLLGFELLDPFGIQTLEAGNQPLKGGGALTAIAQACSDFGVDAIACVADALHEGASGAIGDSGLAYGPFQDHLTQYQGRPFYGRGAYNQTVNAWAWTENGIRYSVRQMVTGSPSARGLHGHAAIYAIVYGYERPGDEAGAYRTRVAEFDHLVSLGSGWAEYAAGKFAGPAAGGATDTAPIGAASSARYKPAGVAAQWRELVNVFRLTVPKQHARADSLGKSFVEVFR